MNYRHFVQIVAIFRKFTYGIFTRYFYSLRNRKCVYNKPYAVKRFHMGGLSYKDTNRTVDSEMSLGPSVNLLVHLLK